MKTLRFFLLLACGLCIGAASVAGDLKSGSGSPRANTDASADLRGARANGPRAPAKSNGGQRQAHPLAPRPRGVASTAAPSRPLNANPARRTVSGEIQVPGARLTRRFPSAANAAAFGRPQSLRAPPGLARPIAVAPPIRRAAFGARAAAAGAAIIGGPADAVKSRSAASVGGSFNSAGTAAALNGSRLSRKR